MKKRKILIDTDTGSDDALSIAMALREPMFDVVAITTVAGNVPLETATENALMTIDYAERYKPPVYMGCSKPLFRELLTADSVHGKDGMGDLGIFTKSRRKPEEEHAVDAIIRFADMGDVEFHTIGPLTNIAVAIMQDPDAMRKIPKITMMGGAIFRGNTGHLAEFNFWQDAEAADIVFNFGIPITTITIEACANPDTRILEEDMSMLKNSGSRLAAFCVDCNSTMAENVFRNSGERYFVTADPTATAVMARPDLIKKSVTSYTRFDTDGEYTYGMTVNDLRKADSIYISKDTVLKPHNCTIVYEVDGAGFKEYLFSLII
ncbi:MAG: nucleoside hydrolase [Ruminococcaceae bacterium]|nr:nucleoside hydrolase [Oscillospiraceae bacterium]